MKIPFKWERMGVVGDTYRSKVIGGWIVCNIVHSKDWDYEQATQSQSMVFVPDTEHKWVIDRENEKG